PGTHETLAWGIGWVRGLRKHWVAASQSAKQVLSQAATRSFISSMSSADFAPDHGGDFAKGDDGGKVMVCDGATDWAEADSATRHRTRKQTALRMIDPRGIEEAATKTICQ